MISITRLAQAQKNLEQDLKRVYESAYKSIESGNPDEEWALFDLSEEELLEVFIRNGEEDFTEDELSEFKDEIRASAFWKVYSHWFRLIKPLSPLLRSFPKVGAFLLSFSYDCLIHPILFSSWHWNDYGDIDSNSLGLSLSSNEIYDELKKCNPDVVSVFLSNLDNCSIADREMLQETYNSDQKELFVNKLKTLSITDYNRLVYVTAFSHFENAAISFDIDTLRILFHHIDFGEDFKIDLSFLPEEDMFDCIKVDYWKQFIPNDDATEDEVSEAINNLSDKIKSSQDRLLRCFSALKYEIPRALESLKPFPFERKFLDNVLADPEVKSILNEITENPFENDKTPDGQKQPETKPMIVQPVDQKPREEKKPNDMEYVPHWPTDEELKWFDDIDDDSQFFTNTLWGAPDNVKASNIGELLDILVDLKIINNELNTKLIFLARYTGKRAPHLELQRIEWKMRDSVNRERALGYLMLKTAGAQYAKGKMFFYYEIEGKKIMPDKGALGQGAHALNKPTRRDTTRIEFEHKLNKFLDDFMRDQEE